MAFLSVAFGLLWLLASVIEPCLGQTSKLFQWAFKDSLSTSLPTCHPLGIVVKSFNPTLNDTHGTPPYYMMAFDIGATPSTTLIGIEEDNLSWTVTAPVGSRLALSVVDANGSAGGLPPQIFTVIAGSTTQCVTGTLQTPGFKVTANITGDLTTCQPWGLAITGGVPPYNLTLVQPNSPVVTNVTLPFGDNHFTYINRANPGGQLIAAISDLTGRWATGTPIVNTKGSSNVDCIGLVSSSGDTATIEAANAAVAAASAKRQKGVVTGVAVTIVLLFLIGLGIGSFFYFRKRKRLWQIEEANAHPRQFPQPYTEIGSQSQVLSINNFLSAPSTATPPPPPSKGGLPEARSRVSPPLARSESPSQLSLAGSRTTRAPGGDTNSPNLPPPLRTRSNDSVSSRPSFTSFPSTSVRRSAKAAEAGVLILAGSPVTEDLEPALSESHSQVLSWNLATGTESSGIRAGLPLNRPGVPTVREEGSDNGGAVFQHEDAAMVRELPPPYKNYRDGGGVLQSSISRHLST